MLTTPGGVWSGNGIQANGDINVGGSNTIINAIYTLPNGCSDTLLVSVEGVSTQLDDTICQNSGLYPLAFTPPNGNLGSDFTKSLTKQDPASNSFIAISSPRSISLVKTAAPRP